MGVYIRVILGFISTLFRCCGAGMLRHITSCSINDDILHQLSAVVLHPLNATALFQLNAVTLASLNPASRA